MIIRVIPIGTLEGTPNYAHLDGTSMSSPHVAGAVALIKQAHLDWSPDMIRAALINTATNMRSESGVPKAEGLTADSIIAQGGGLIDVAEAVRAKALMGVVGDGINSPGILGSHSFGEVFVINSRVTHPSPIQVTVRDVSGQGGTYNLGVANNRDLQLAGINVSLSTQSVSLQPNGEATFTVNASVDGDLLRDVMVAKTNGSQVIFEKIPDAVVRNGPAQRRRRVAMNALLLPAVSHHAHRTGCGNHGALRHLAGG